MASFSRIIIVIAYNLLTKRWKITDLRHPKVFIVCILISVRIDNASYSESL